MSIADDRQVTWAVIGGVALYTIVAIATLQPGHSWGDDFALYIGHAINIVNGAPYADIGYISNPLNPYVGPAYAPPMAPLVLAGVYKIFGLDFIAMKAVLLLFLSATLLLIYFYYWRLSTATIAALVVAITAINPYVWNFRDNIVTEFVFMFLMWASLLLLEVREQSPTLRGQLIAAGLAGAMAYLATATREIGIILIPAVIFYDLLRRRLGMSAALFVLVFLGGYVVQLAFGLNLDKAYEGDDVNYMRTLFGWSNIADNLFHYIVSLRRVFPGPIAVTALLMTILAALIAYGVYREWTRFLPRGEKQSFRDLAAGVIRGIRLQDVLAGGYLLAICLLPFRSEPRYLLPILPVAFFYVVVGAKYAVERLAPARHASAAAAALLAAFLLYHAGYYLTAKAAPVQGVGTPQSVQLFNAIRAQLPKDAVVVFRKSRAMALFGQRRSTVWGRRVDEETAWRNMAELGATHLVIPRSETGLDVPDYLRYDLKSPPPAFLEPVFANDHFTVFRILRFPKPDELTGAALRQHG